MKKIGSIFLIIMLVCSMAGCGSQDMGMSAISREESEGDGIVWFDEEAVALAGSVVNDSMSESEKNRAEELNAMAKEVLDLVNARRAEEGLKALEWDKGLETCALVRAQEIVTKFSHTRPNGQSWYTVNSDLMWGENLAKGYTSAEEVMEAWMNSPSHAENILMADFTACGIAIYEKNGKLYFAQEFCY